MCRIVYLVSAWLAVVAAAPDTAGRDFIFVPAEEVSGSISANPVGVDSTLCTTSSLENGTLVYEEITVTPGKALPGEAVGITCDDEITVTLSSHGRLSPVYPKALLSGEYAAIAKDLVLTAVHSDAELKLIAKSGEDYEDIELRNLSRGEHFWMNLRDGRNTQVTADRPILALNGDKGKGMLSLPPTNTWGKKYLLRENSHKLIGNNASCTLGDQKIDLIDIQTVTGSGMLDCDRPVLVAAVLADQSLSSFVPSISQFSNDVTLFVPSDSGSYNLDLLISEADLTEELRINDQSALDFPEKSESVPIGGGYVQLHYVVSGGTARVHHENPTVVFYASIRNDGQENTIVSLPTLRMVKTGSYCVMSINAVDESSANDGIDNDCDSLVDEELLNGLDDDNDGLVDEDIATNDFYSDMRDNSGSWPLSYTVLLLVILVVLLVVLIGVCHWKCSTCDPEIKDSEQDAMIASYDSRNTVPARYCISGSTTGFTISRRG